MMKTHEKNRGAVAAIVPDYRYPLKNGRITLKIRITHNRTQRYYPITLEPKDKIKEGIPDIERVSIEFGINKGRSITLLPNDVKQVMKQNPGKEKYVILKTILEAYREKATDVINRIENFSFDQFVGKYFSKPTDEDDLFSVMASTGKEMRNEGRISTAVTFECSLKSLKDFAGKEKLSFDNVNVKFLKDYEKWMLSKENSRTTVGIYLRNVRTVFNKVKPVNVLYPFGKSKHHLYSIPKGKNTKKALTQADVAKIAAYPTIKGTVEQQSRDYWVFSYLCNGINIKDVARLKYSNINDDKISLIRAKTAETTDEETTIDIIITRQIGRIIDLHGNKPTTQDQYIFPILHNGMTAEDEYRAIQQAVQTINKNMANICKEIGIDRATTYTARHSFATVLKRSGASVEFISESLGHKSKQTTQNYLANFEDDEKRKWAKTLLPGNYDRV